MVPPSKRVMADPNWARKTLHFPTSSKRVWAVAIFALKHRMFYQPKRVMSDKGEWPIAYSAGGGEYTHYTNYTNNWYNSPIILEIIQIICIISIIPPIILQIIQIIGKI